MKETFYIIDGNALLHRAWHALPPLATKDGKLVNAVYGFLLILLKLLREEKPTFLAVAFDMAAPTFRHDAYEAYKAQRVKAPDELYAQIPILHEVLGAFGIPIFQMSGFEADDIIGTIATITAKKKIETFVVTGDLDTLQLVGHYVRIYTFGRGIKEIVIYDEAAVKARYGLAPNQMIDYKALRGDPSDNIKGVRGIGEKTAAELLQTFGTLEELFSELKKKSPKAMKLRESVREKLLSGEEDAEMSKNLVTIRLDVPIEFDLHATRMGEPDREKLTTMFSELGFRSLVEKLPSSANVSEVSKVTKVAKEQKKVEYELIRTGAGVDELSKKLAKTDRFVVRAWPRSEDIFSKDLLGVAICWQENHAVFVSHEQLKKLAPILNDQNKTKIGHDLKKDLHLIYRGSTSEDKNRSEVEPPLEDLMVASYLLSPGSRAHDLPDLVFEHFGRELPVSSAQGSLLPPRIEDVYKNVCLEADYIWQMRDKLFPELIKRSQEKLFREIEMPLIPSLVAMERHGVKIDSGYLNEMAGRFNKRLEKISAEVYKMAGEEFNINSPAQLKKILFEKLKISTQKIKKTAGGTLSTAAGELERLRGLHPIIELIFEHRELSKLNSTYVEALPALVRKETGRVHTTFNQTVTATGRLSSSNPNLQNIPIRSELGREIRKAFIAERGNIFISADYSQIELRLAAVIARVPKMLAAFRDGADIHTRTAAEIWNIPVEKITKEQRRAAKAINFGIIYGIGPTSLAESAGISFAEAKEFIQRYFDLYPELKNYLDETKALAASLGYVETIFGRRRYLPEITSGVPQVRAAAERMAINAPVQGSAADLMKLATNAIHEWIEREYGLGADSPVKMIIQVHDALVFEVKKDLVSKVAGRVKDMMENIHKFEIPIIVDVEAGRSWGELKAIE